MSHACPWHPGLQVLPSGVDVTRRDQFLPCTLSGLGKEMSKIDDCVGSANGFNLQVAAAPASVSIAEIMGASEVVVQGKVDNGGGRALQGRMDSGEYRFLSLRIPPGAAQGQGIWDNASALLVRVSLQLRDGHAGLSTASRIPRGSLRASAASAFPLEQLGAGQYQIANQCSPNCTLVVPVTVMPVLPSKPLALPSPPAWWPFRKSFHLPWAWS